MRVKLIFLYIIVAVALPALEFPSLRNGHTHPITLLHQKNTLLFSGDSSGILKAWNEEGDMVFSSRISDMPIYRIDFSRENNILAVLSGTPGSNTRLSVLSWKTKKELYTLMLKDTPQNLSISPGGRYIVYTTFGIDSIHAIDALRGKKSSFIPWQEKMISAFAISSNEQRIMTYSATSGMLNYYTIRSGELIQSVKTERGLKNLQILTDKRYATGIQGNTLFVIDLLNGNVVDSRSFEDSIQSYAVLENNAALLLRKKTPAKGTHYTVRSHFIQSGILSAGKVIITTSTPIWNNIALLTKDTAIISDDSGNLYRLNSTTKEISDFAIDNTLPVKSFLIEDDVITVANKEYILKFHISLTELIDALHSKKNRTLYYRSQKHLPGDLDTTFYNNNAAILLTTLSPTLKESIHKENIANILHSQISGDYLIMFTKDKTLHLYDIPENRKFFEYSSIGTETAYYIEGKGVYLGLSAHTNPFGTALNHLNPHTGEVFPLKSGLFLIFDINYDPSTNTLWCIGLQNYNSSVRTVLEGHTGENFEFFWVEEYFQGEAMNTRLVLNEASNSIVFFSTEKHQAERNRKYNTPETAFLHSVQIYNSYMLGINNNGSLVILNNKSGKTILLLHLMSGGQWLAVFNSYYVAPESIKIRKYFNNTQTAIEQRRHPGVQVQKILQAGE